MKKVLFYGLLCFGVILFAPKQIGSEILKAEEVIYNFIDWFIESQIHKDDLTLLNQKDDLIEDLKKVDYFYPSKRFFVFYLGKGYNQRVNEISKDQFEDLLGVKNKNTETVEEIYRHILGQFLVFMERACKEENPNYASHYLLLLPIDICLKSLIHWYGYSELDCTEIWIDCLFTSLIKINNLNDRNKILNNPVLKKFIREKQKRYQEIIKIQS